MKKRKKTTMGDEDDDDNDDNHCSFASRYLRNDDHASRSTWKCYAKRMNGGEGGGGCHYHPCKMAENRYNSNDTLASSDYYRIKWPGM